MRRLYYSPERMTVRERVIIPWGVLLDTVLKLAAGAAVLLAVFG